MHEDAPLLAAAKREKIGSRAARRAREEGRLPAIVYGHKQEPLPVEVDAHETLIHLHKGEKVFRLQLEGANDGEFVLVKDLQYDHLGTNIVHCDFERVDLDERVTVNVPIHFTGEADCKGLKMSGATLMHPTTELQLECPVSELPEYIEVNVRELPFGGTITAGQVQLPSRSMKLLNDPSEAVAHIVGQSAPMGEGEGEAAEVSAGAEPEIITEKAAEEEG